MKQRLFLDTRKCSLHQFVITFNEEKMRVASGILRPYPIFIGYKACCGKGNSYTRPLVSGMYRASGLH